VRVLTLPLAQELLADRAQLTLVLVLRLGLVPGQLH
jgi:hypothetical protein